MISTRRRIEREVFVVERFSALTAIKEVMAMQLLEFVMLNGAQMLLQQKVNCNSIRFNAGRVYLERNGK